jgi:hypothetical protein
MKLDRLPSSPLCRIVGNASRRLSRSVGALTFTSKSSLDQKWAMLTTTVSEMSAKTCKRFCRCGQKTNRPVLVYARVPNKNNHNANYRGLADTRMLLVQNLFKKIPSLEVVFLLGFSWRSTLGVDGRTWFTEVIISGEVP